MDTSRLPRTAHRHLTAPASCALLAVMLLPLTAHGFDGALDPDLEKQEREVERMLRSAEDEFWTLKRRIERERTGRDHRVARARADYERARQAAAATDGKPGSDLATHRAEVALERYHTELERAMTGVDSARIALEMIEDRVNRHRAALDALRRRGRGADDAAGPTPTVPDSTGAGVPITTAGSANAVLKKS